MKKQLSKMFLTVAALLLAAPAWAVFYNGLYGGSMSGAYVTSGLPTSYEVYDGAVKVYDTTGFDNNTTWVYWGQMYLDGGDYTFQKDKWDDGIYLVIDGEVVIDNNSYSAVVTQTVSGKPAGWYSFEIRAGQGTGGVGGNFYYWKGSSVGTEEERLRIMNDDPENPVFRCARKNFTVTGTLEIGTVSPSYGAGWASDGETITFTATGTTRYTCMGYELSLTVDGVKTILASGDGSSFEWTYTDEYDGAVLEWKWAFTGAQDVYWAAPDGTEDAACTEAEPGTIAAAIAKCVARESFESGDVVMLKKGVYDFTGVECANDRTSALIPVSKDFVTIKSETDNPEDCIIHGWGTVVTETELKDDDGNVTNTVTTTTYNLQRCFSVTGPALIRSIRIENFTAPNNGYLTPVTGVFKTVATELGVLEVENCVIAGLSRPSGTQYIYGALCDGGVYRDCVVTNFTDRVNGGFGGALCGGNARFERCKIQQSDANYSLFSGSSVLVDCVFEGNRQYGNSPCICQNVGLVQNCSFFTNQAMCVFSTSTSESVETRLDGCTFVGNYLSGFNGAGISAKNRTAVLVTNSRFEDNHVSSPIAEGSDCGGVAGWYGAYSNCVFRGNWTSSQRGGGTVRYAALQNCTIEGNYATSGSSCGLMNCVAINCLVKDNNQQNGQPVNYGNMLLNCTVVGSVTTSAAVQSGAATNTIVYGTSGGVDIDTGDYSHVLYGTSSDAGTLTDCAQLAEDPFSGSATPETPYLPKRKSGAVETGILLAEVGSVDYYGNKRLAGKALDIGCAEYPLLNGTTILLR
ncbi:MAG: right-handed parallel beta-helix repeat-containing protein [Kiritimatiellia bacterium]